MPGAAPCCSWTATASIRRTLVEQLVGHWIDGGYDVVYTAKAHRDNESLLRRLAVRGFYAADQLGRAAEDPGGCRRLPPAVAARGGGAAAASRAQPLLQGAGKLDRLPPDPRRLRARAARARRDHLQRRPAARAFDRRADVVLGGAAALCEPARRPARLRRLPVRAFDPVGSLHHRKAGSRLSIAGGRPDDDRRRAADHDRHRRRIYRQDPVRAEGASDLFRRRAQREALRGRYEAAERSERTAAE